MSKPCYGFVDEAEARAWLGTLDRHSIWRIGAILDPDLWEAHSPNHAGYGKTPLVAISRLRDKMCPGWRETRDPLNPGKDLPKGWVYRTISGTALWSHHFGDKELRLLLTNTGVRQWFKLYLILPGFCESVCYNNFFYTWWDAMEFAEKWAEENLRAA